MLREVFEHPVTQIIAEVSAHFFCVPDVKIKAVLPAKMVKVMQYL